MASYSSSCFTFFNSSLTALSIAGGFTSPCWHLLSWDWVCCLLYLKCMVLVDTLALSVFNPAIFISC
ncbi:hypothetical protein I79_001589 [Cricetulus griseus]|uniref:Uncharacterized protein n=1 Tax=Cricetulus griseus TaxID=10029 RepID=G3GV58_CRIGR|nr:hypothetical protein I79_001589 [Cricetulus griseus]